MAGGIDGVVKILVGLDAPEGAADGGGGLWGIDRFAFGGGKFGEEGCDRFFILWNMAVPAAPGCWRPARKGFTAVRINRWPAPAGRPCSLSLLAILVYERLLENAVSELSGLRLAIVVQVRPREELLVLLSGSQRHNGLVLGDIGPPAGAADVGDRAGDARGFIEQKSSDVSVAAQAALIAADRPRCGTGYRERRHATGLKVEVNRIISTRGG